MSELAKYIKHNQSNGLTKRIFHKPFQTLSGWYSYLYDNLAIPAEVERNGGTIDIRYILKSPMKTNHFQALYVACWITQPVEKGSYMLQIPEPYLNNVKEQYKKIHGWNYLGHGRLSSHLRKIGVSAHNDWKFIKGYNELLIQIEQGNQLFLKCEGHTVVIGALPHLSSLISKQATGRGVTANKHLRNEAVKSSSPFTPRSAENYSPQYKSLIKSLGLDTKNTTVNKMLNAASEKLHFSLRHPGYTMMPTRQKMDIFIAAVKRGETNSLGTTFTEKHLIKRNVTITHASAPQEYQNHTNALLKDLERIKNQLEQDTGIEEIKRVFQEVRLTPDQINKGLKQFISENEDYSNPYIEWLQQRSKRQ